MQLVGNVRIALIALVVGVFTIDSAHGSMARALSNQTMAETADVIVTGRCVGVRSTWQDRRLVTMATIAVSETIKGDAATTLSVILPGGVDLKRKFPIAAIAAGAPQIALQEDVFLFLARRRAVAGEHTVLGFSQGKYSIVRNARGQRMVSRNLTSVTLASSSGARAGAASERPLDAFTEEIRGYLRAR